MFTRTASEMARANEIARIRFTDWRIQQDALCKSYDTHLLSQYLRDRLPLSIQSHYTIVFYSKFIKLRLILSRLPFNNLTFWYIFKMPAPRIHHQTHSVRKRHQRHGGHNRPARQRQDTTNSAKANLKTSSSRRSSAIRICNGFPTEIVKIASSSMTSASLVLGPLTHQTSAGRYRGMIPDCAKTLWPAYEMPRFAGRALSQVSTGPMG